VTAAEESRKTWVEERHKAQAEVDLHVRKAEETCPQRVAVPSDKTSEELENMLQKLVNTRQETERELGGSQDELLRAANQARRAHQEARKEFDEIEAVKTVRLIDIFSLTHLTHV
jgi:hypothetical protein